jgi:hypothetical protein
MDQVVTAFLLNSPHTDFGGSHLLPEVRGRNFLRSLLGLLTSKPSGGNQQNKGIKMGKNYGLKGIEIRSKNDFLRKTRFGSLILNCQ